MAPLNQQEAKQLIGLLQQLTHHLQDQARAPFVPLGDA